MKIALLGPVITDKYYGGVAIFDEELAQGFVDNGWEAVLITQQSEAKQIHQINNIPVMVIDRLNAENIFKKECPDVVIASLNYAKFLKKCKNIKTKKIYFLHGFFNQNYYGKIKSEIAVIYQKYLIRQCDLTFANSAFTRTINEDFFGIKVDEVFHLGVSDFFFNKIFNTSIQKEPKTILYAGRLVSAKGVLVLIKALKRLNENGVNYHAFIAGTGEEETAMKEIANANGLPVTFLGRLNQEQLVEYYCKSEIFVSLNHSEPFGIVFLEALLAHCKIICPKTGGQVEYLNEFHQSVYYVDENSCDDIATGLEKMIECDKLVELSNCQKEKFTYKNVANYMIDYLSSNILKGIEYGKK